MGLVVDLGLKRYFSDEDERIAAVTALVAAGHCPRLREVFFSEGAVHRVFEAKKGDGGVETRWFEGEELESARQRAAKIIGTTTWVGFSWSELEEVGAYDVQTLALPFEWETSSPVDVAIGTQHIRAHCHGTGGANWSEVNTNTSAAGNLFWLAAELDLLVHSE